MIVPSDIVCFYAEIGRPYLPLIDRMLASARKVYPSARLICLSPTPAAVRHCDFDLVLEAPVKVSERNLCIEKARALASWGARCEAAALFVDVDVEFRAPFRVITTAAVGVIWRERKMAQPANSGLVFMRPGAEGFWRQYLRAASGLPDVLHAWFCDQLALSVMIGSHHRAGETITVWGSRVLLLDEAIWLPAADKARDDSPAIHFKGALKGEGWDRIFVAKSGAGKSSPASP